MERFLYGYLIPFAMAFALLAIGIYFVLETLPTLLDIARGGAATVQQPEIVASQQVFKDVLQTVLAVAALSIAAFGYGTYRILSSQIEERVRKGIEGRYQTPLAHHRAELGYMNWMLYENSKQDSKIDKEIAKGYLDEAIRHTRIAFDEHALDLDEKDRTIERLVCDIRNNWAYYASEKHIEFGGISDHEQAQFLSFANWLEARSDNHSDNASDYRDTIDTVRERFKRSDTKTTK